MLTDQEPSSTRLINIPVQLSDGTKAKLLLYTNDLETGGKGALMIVPIPNPTKSTAAFGLVNASDPKIKAFRTKLFEECALLEDEDDGDFSDDELKKAIPDFFSRSLAVHGVGNYRISLAPTLKDLTSRVDWSKFTRPSDFKTRFKTFINNELYPFPCAYIVAEAQKSIKDDGFGVIYPDPGFTYFPTAHEERSTSLDDTSSESLFTNLFPLSDSVSEKNHKFDVKLYDCFAPAQAATHLEKQICFTYQLTDPKIIHSIFSKIDVSYINPETSMEGTFKIRNTHININYTPIVRTCKNANIVIS